MLEAFLYTNPLRAIALILEGIVFTIPASHVDFHEQIAPIKYSVTAAIRKHSGQNPYYPYDRSTLISAVKHLEYFHSRIPENEGLLDEKVDSIINQLMEVIGAIEANHETKRILHLTHEDMPPLFSMPSNSSDGETDSEEEYMTEMSALKLLIGR